MRTHPTSPGSFRTRKNRTLSIPGGIPQVHSRGINPDRILLFGSGPAVGLGMPSHDAALPGRVAQALTAITGRGTDIDVVASRDITAANAVDVLDSHHVDRYDAIVIFLGVSDAVAMMPEKEWRRSLFELARFALAESSASTSVTFATLEPRQVPWDSLRGSAEKHIRLLNLNASEIAAIRFTATDDRLGHIGLEASAGRIEKVRSAAEYQQWANQIAQALAPRLTAAATVDPRQLAAVGNTHSLSRPRWRQDEGDRARSVERLRLLDSAPDARIDAIVARAKAKFGLAGAAFTVLDTDRMWAKSTTGGMPQQVGLDQSICKMTIQSSGPFIVPDTSIDDRIVGARHPKFYAGFPIEAPDGQRIGSLCVYDSEAHDASVIDQSVLRDFALEIQQELWRYEPGAAQ
ncbi:hypothetical protein [Glaciihabitans sp. dw_435]|uniref:hypothetical protein n=1 Tax=Glaciihabitans sp. dw_435 TaxID=2720081 RepID=UPI001BD1DBBE|nr:hypothetical protein [Glaciihabitans sp. dw_435]